MAQLIGGPNQLVTRAILAALLALSVSELAAFYISAGIFQPLGRLSLVALVLFSAPRFSLREWGLSLLALFLAVGLLASENGAAMLAESLDKAAFFAAFIYLITLLKEGAERSDSVLQMGRYLTNQPPGRRYYSTAIGGHLMGVLLNFGAVSLLAPLIQRGAKASADASPQEKRRAAIQEQRQLSALLRGFSWMIMWAPTTLTQTVLFAAFPSADFGLIVMLGLIATVIMVLIGRVEDWLRWRHLSPWVAANAMKLPKKSARVLLIVCTTLAAGTYFVVVFADVTVAVGLMLVAPIVLVVWIAKQNTTEPYRPALKQTWQDLKGLMIGSTSNLGRSAVGLGAAGFIGVAAAKLAPIDLIADQLGGADIPTWVVLISLPVIINLGGQIALSPIMIVVFLSSVLNALPVLPADPSLIVFALGAGWALSMTASPNATATLLISGVSGIPPTTLTWKWNGVYSLLCFCAFFGMFYALTLWF